MNETHVSIEEMLAFAEGTADAAEAVATGRHLATCDRCAAIADEMLGGEAHRAFVDAVEVERDDRPAVFPRALAIAAVIAIAIAAVFAIVILVRNRTVTPAVPKTASIPAKTPAAGYDRADWDALVRDALARGSVSLAAPAVATPDVLRDGAAARQVGMTPSATVVESPQPELTWPEVPGARYVVSINAGDRVIAHSPTLDGNRWTPAQPLPRGTTLTWQVRATRGDQLRILPPPPQPHPAFAVIGADAQRDLDEARARFPNDHLLLGVLAAHDGLRDVAQRELGVAAKVRLEGGGTPP